MDTVSRRASRSILPYAAVAALAAALPALALVLRNGHAGSTAAPTAEPRTAGPKLPPRGGLVLARESGRLGVALSARPVAGRGVELTVTLLGPDGDGVSGRQVSVVAQGRRAVAAPCGAGCYAASLPSAARRVVVLVAGRPVPFELPERTLPAAVLVRRVDSAIRRARSLVIDERLASSPTHAIRARFEIAAPNRLTYRIAGGAQAVVIGGRRWDHASAREQWVRSSQTPLRLPAPTWTAVRDARLVAADRRAFTVTFLDPTIPAWFTVRADRRTFRPAEVRMVAAGHFMRDRYSRYDVPIRIRPPSRGG
jgi:hypothetical protein